MKMQSDVKVLIEKFHQGIASAEELRTLYSLLQEENNPEILSLIDQEWTRIADENNTPVTDTLLNRIPKKAGNSDSENGGFVRVIRYLLPYAAVFVLAFLLTWFLKPDSPLSLSETDDNEVNYFRIEVPYGSKSSIELPDSSKVVLNSGSRLEYPDHFGTSDRTVFLHGEAYFDVKRNKNKPFYVKTDEVTIKVLGTQFNVKSYPEDNIMETILVSGSVEILPNEQTFNAKNQEYNHCLLCYNLVLVQCIHY